ncbi:glutamyl-tRNA(Gln) amidotransferase subunit F [Microdochium nivale]|nr:glutamyl-tRNA(Gln) amidotransferase subunit F [Microdochium nivale]
MSSMRCYHCRLALRCTPLRHVKTSQFPRRDIRAMLGARPSSSSSSSRSSSAPSQEGADITAILSKPSWSVRSLLPPSSSASSLTSASTPSPTASLTRHEGSIVTSKTLRHLLRLSALPPPSSPEAEVDLLNTLSSQLHFVRAIQQVDTEGIEPLRSIRDETLEGLKEQTIGLHELKEALANEDIVGHARRPRRKRVPAMKPGIEDWDVLANASETVGPYFVVRSGVAGAEQARNKP